jgi:hypothetical protein
MAGAGSSSVPGQLSLSFAAGAVGAVVNMSAAWLFDRMGLFHLLGCDISIAANKYWIYSRLVWGGIFGLFLVLPVLTNSVLKRGLLLGLLPAAFQLFVVFPIFLHQSVMGINHGVTTPLFVIALNLLWGMAAAGWLKMTG